MKCDRRLVGHSTQYRQLVKSYLIGVYDTQNSQQTYELESIFESYDARMSDNEENQQREG